MTEAECIQRVRELTDGVNHHHFQQWPEELGKMIHLLLEQPGNIKNYLEIGAGAGHVARVLDMFFEFAAVRLIDNGRHFTGRLQQVPEAMEWVGDSRLPEAAEVIHKWGIRFDLIFIDADHAYESVKADTLMALRCIADPCCICLHDTERSGVKRWLGELRGARPCPAWRMTVLNEWVHAPGNRGTAVVYCEPRATSAAKEQN